jgi:hypothetical protein
VVQDAALDQRSPGASPPNLQEQQADAEQRAITAIELGDLRAAERPLRALLPEAEAQGDYTPLFLHSPGNVHFQLCLVT